MAFLDYNGLSYYDDKIKEYIDNSVGSKVSYEQIVKDGTKVGTIVINGESTDILVPESSGFEEVTLAEYTALPDSKLTDGKAYIITDLEPMDAYNIAYKNTTVGDKLDEGSSVSYEQTLESGIKIGTLTINGEDNDIITPSIEGLATEKYVDDAIDAIDLAKADKATTLAGYGITDACFYTDPRLSDARPASDVSAWAKASKKPTYTASEVGAATSTDITNAIDALDVTGESGIGSNKTILSWSETNGKVSVTTQNIIITTENISDFPTSLPASNTTSTYSATGTAPVNGTAVASAISNKVDKVSGKGLSTNDFTNTYKTAIDNLPTSYAPTNAQANVIESIKVNGTAQTITNKAVDITVPTKASDIGAMASTVTHLSGDIATTEKGAANGVATLGTDGKVPSSQLPSYVDDVLEYSAKTSFPATGESGKIYVNTADNKTYRWSGSAYVEISPSIVVGTTTGTAFDGKVGNDHINNTSNPHSVTKAQVGLGNVENKSSATIRGELTKANVTTALGYTPPTSDTTYTSKTAASGGTDVSLVTTGEKYTWNNKGTYSKPSGGIPKTDLASAVQTSLGKADTALQSHQDISGKQDKLTAGTNISISGTTISATDTVTTYYGTCSTTSATAAKVVTCANTNFKLVAGAIIGVKFSANNTASNVTLNVNNTGAKSIWYDTAAYAGSSTTVCGYTNRIIYYMYDGTYWVWMSYSLDSNDNTIPSAYCSTAASTAAKVASCTNYILTANTYIHIIFTVSNTAKSAITLNINSKGAKAIWINGVATSTSNYTLPAGTYIAFYDGSKYHIRTDGILPGPGSFKEVTQAQYDALGSFKNSDNVSYIITDADDSFSAYDMPYKDTNVGAELDAQKRPYVDVLGGIKDITVDQLYTIDLSQYTELIIKIALSGSVKYAPLYWHKDMGYNDAYCISNYYSSAYCGCIEFQVRENGLLIPNNWTAVKYNNNTVTTFKVSVIGR